MFDIENHFQLTVNADLVGPSISSTPLQKSASPPGVRAQDRGAAVTRIARCCPAETHCWSTQASVIGGRDLRDPSAQPPAARPRVVAIKQRRPPHTSPRTITLTTRISMLARSTLLRFACSVERQLALNLKST
jgi:hypothetical protein